MNIKFKAKKLVEGGFTASFASLQKREMSHLTVKRFKKIAEAVIEEQSKYIKEGIEIREEIFGKDVDPTLFSVLLSMGTENEKKKLYEHFGEDTEKREDFIKKYNKMNELCIDMGETEIELPLQKLKFPDSFVFPFEMSLELSDIIDLEE